MLERTRADFAEQGSLEALCAFHFLSDKNKDLPDLFNKEKSLWIELEDERAGTAPTGFKSMSMAEFLAFLEKQKTPQRVLLVGSFKLLAEFKRLHS